ncbi:GMC family oxidoreductase [Nostoc sp. NIES-2111]
MKNDFEYVIVGSGVAATLICDRLLEADPRASILVLEAGERIPSRDRRNWWELVLARKTPYSGTYDDDSAESSNQESYSVGNVPWGFRESRVRAYGGSTMHWGGWALRFKEEDFECRSRTGRGADWPFSYDELEPWYSLAEQKLGVGGDAVDEGPRRSGLYPLPAYPWSAHEAELAEGLERNGLRPGHMPIARFRRCMTTGTCKYCPIGARYSAQDHLDQLLFNPLHKNVTLKTGAPVRRILAERNRAEGVEYFDPGSATWTIAHGSQILICAGTYESTKLLLASTSPQWPMGVGNRHDQVGRYVVTHLLFSVEGTRDKNAKRWFQEYDFPTLMSRSWDTPERQADGKMFVFNNRALPKVEFENLMIQGKTRAEIDAIVQGPCRAGLSAFIEEFGDPENRLLLERGTGKFGLPKTTVRFSRRDPSRFLSIVSAAQDELFKSLSFLGYKRDAQRKEFPRGDHASGTCRMGRSPDASVTDSNLAVHGVGNLFVCSNAVLPNAAAVNPTLTLGALALRLGDHLGSGSIV